MNKQQRLVKLEALAELAKQLVIADEKGNKTGRAADVTRAIKTWQKLRKAVLELDGA